MGNQPRSSPRLFYWKGTFVLARRSRQSTKELLLGSYALIAPKGLTERVKFEV